MTLERLRREGFGAGLPSGHAHTVTVPGACAGWCDLIERHGRLPMAAILAPAIRLAEEGFPVAPVTSYWWRAAEGLLRQAPGGPELLIDGRGPRPGEVFRNPGLARTLWQDRRGRQDGLLPGPDRGGHCPGRPAGRRLPERGRPGRPPQHLGRADQHDLPRHPPVGMPAERAGPDRAAGARTSSKASTWPPCPRWAAERLHLEIEALRLAFADTRWYVADPAFSPAPLRGLLSREYAAQRRQLIRPGPGQPGPEARLSGRLEPTRST